MERAVYTPHEYAITAPRRLPGKYKRNKAWEFSWETKRRAMELHDGRCFVTKQRGTKDCMVQIHHGLALNVWYKYFRDQIPVSVITSINNAIPIRQDVHAQLHREADMDHWVQMANLLVVLSRENNPYVGFE